MNNKIHEILSRLSIQSELENSDKVQVPHGQRMLAITPETGKFFNLLLKATKSKRVLEIGTSTGYSTLWFADALLEINKDCKIITIEANSAKIKRAKKNFEEAGVFNFINIKEGQAINILQKMNEKIRNESEKFDFVFIDADKESMISYFDLGLSLVKVGGIIAADNILYPEKFRPFMKKYSDHVESLCNVQSVLVPIGNGEEISFKLKD